MTSLRSFDVPEVIEFQEVPLSDEVRIVPESPTETYDLVVVVVSSVVVVVVVVSSSSVSLAQEKMMRLKRNTNKMYKFLFIIHSISNEKRRFEELHFQKFTNRLSDQSDIIVHTRLNFMYVKTFFSDLEGDVTRMWGFYL